MKHIQFISTDDKSSWVLRNDFTKTSEKPNLVIHGRSERELEGFGGCFNELGYIALSKLSHEQKEKIMDDLFLPAGECRLNMARAPIGASDYALSWYSLNDHEDDYAMDHFTIERDKKYLIPYIRDALKRRTDLQIFASPWSPPVWLKTQQAYNFGYLKEDELSQNAYANYFRKYIEHYLQEGISISQIHIQNEVCADQKFPSCRWTGEQLRKFTAEYLGPLFKKHHVPAEIWLGTINAPEFFHEVGQDYDDYANYVLSDQTAYQYIAGVGYQWAGKYAIQRTVDAYPELRFYQTENECGDGNNDWPYAHYVFGLFRHYFVNGANAYFYWNMVLEDGGESTWGWHQNSMITVKASTGEVTYNPEYYVMRHFSGLVAKGARRLLLNGRYCGNAIGFENLDGSRVININNSFDTVRNLCLEIDNDVYQFELQPNSINSIVID